MQQTSQPPLQHIAIICDGNRRWARSRGLEVFAGHKRAVEEVFEVLINRAMEIGLPYLTFWIFSTENWDRDKKEIDFLMQLFRSIFDKQLKNWNEAGVRLRVIGDPTALAPDIQERIARGLVETENNTKLNLTLAINYGGRDELTRAVKKMAAAVEEKELSSADITQKTITNYLDTAGLPDPDVIVRTSGEHRMSGFMPWQQQYSEFIFVPWNYPDFTAERFDEVIAEFSKRTRRFGGG